MYQTNKNTLLQGNKKDLIIRKIYLLFFLLKLFISISLFGYSVLTSHCCLYLNPNSDPNFLI